MKNNHTIFDGSSHCADTLGEFCLGEIKNYDELLSYFPSKGWSAQRKEILKWKKQHSIKDGRKLARRIFRTVTGLSVTAAYS